ncbi:MAG: hypothetical protein A2428_07460 [Bdellovibrionales bacterium RIFOXYC1_FULL_54_43]|nr:MAG: hypothetical protein A2428_07460 [Bdellovibrionales bacterium RIFOXYC1_FULL_54_43]OFZ83779.1 MAG: hypothetical protein A2603_12655 [Bdellovibrionales bacterium RIFOXYD1_FULL_55_31]
MRFAAPLNHEPRPVLQSIEVASSLQIPNFQIIGLPCPEVAEARERIRAAIETSGFEFPKRRVVLNLSPASVRKRGTGLDLAMALAILEAHSKSNRNRERPVEFVVAWGELGLDGRVKPAGQLTRALYASWAAQARIILVPKEEFSRAVEALNWMSRSQTFDFRAPVLIPISTLREAWDVIRNSNAENSQKIDSTPAVPDAKYSPPIDDLLALPPSLERTIGIAASGSHHILLLGPRGTGKSHALEWLIRLQPELSARTLVENALVTELAQGISQTSDSSPLLPVRRIGAQVRPAALIGAANSFFVRPGEFSLAHGGLLIADEFPEWPRDSREVLREPLENGVVTLTRASGSMQVPARFNFAANGNLCPCGGWPSHFPIPQEYRVSGRRPPRCKCGKAARDHYLARISGPVLDRIDLVSLVVTQKSRKSRSKAERHSKMTVAKQRFDFLSEKTARTRNRAVSRLGNVPGLLAPAELERLLQDHPTWAHQLESLRLENFRCRHKILRVALSLACWDEIPEPSSAQWLEAACYRPERLGLF